MSKTTSSNKFRKVDVDQYDTERFVEESEDGNQQGPNEAEVNNFLMQYPFLASMPDAFSFTLI